MPFIDSHTHIQFSQFDDDREQIMSSMADSDISAIIVGTDAETSVKAVDLASKNDNFFASVGLHPNDIINENFNADFYRELVADAGVVSVGECGLDYYRKDLSDADKKMQKEVFSEQIHLAVMCQKPLMVHCRPHQGSMDAYEEILKILEEVKKEKGDALKGNIHFFAGNMEIARRFFNLDFTISFTGVITFTDDYNEIVSSSPLDKILAETDSPFVAPKPHRGKRNEPAYIIDIVKRIIELRDEDDDVIRQAIFDNTCRLFNIS